MRVLFLSGFDRSGSSMIGGLLGKHPQVAYFFQPFNRTEIHSTQYELWKPGDKFAETELFLEEFLRGKVKHSYLGADLFDRHSTARAPQEGYLNVVKDTKLHFKLGWMKARFPAIEHLGIWREPGGILCSLLRNGFARDWYGARAYEAIRRAIAATPVLEPYLPWLDGQLEDYEQVALVIAARTHVLAAELGPDNWVAYEDVLQDCDAVLNRWTETFGLAPYEFSAHLGEDFNVVGKQSEGAELWRSYFSAEQLARLTSIFAGLSSVRPPECDRSQSAT